MHITKSALYSYTFVSGSFSFIVRVNSDTKTEPKMLMETPVQQINGVSCSILALTRSANVS